MPDFPFYNEAEDRPVRHESQLTREEINNKAQDQEDTRYMREYRRNTGFDGNARRAMAIYNVIQTASPDDEISRILLGYIRMIIDKGMEQMTEGEPDFGFEPLGPSDHMKTIIWKHMMKMIMSESNYKVNQEIFMRDYFVMGSGVMEVYTDYPKRTIRVPKDDGFEEVVVRDHRRPKVGIRALNPLDCWRNPNVSDTTQVPSCLKRRVITWNQFAQDYGRAVLANGKPKYKNLDMIKAGSHVCIYEYQDEIRDVFRIYARPFGNESDGNARMPTDEDLGIPILDKPLKIHEVKVGGVTKRSDGLNILGMCNMRWGTLFDQYDINYSGQHSVYGMGLFQRLEGEDQILQTAFNLNLDNYRWSNTVALNYQGDSFDSYIDVDANRLYGGELIDGRIEPQPLGINRIGDFQAMHELIDRLVITATGINFNQIVGDTSKTAFEFAQRMRQANRSAEQRLQRLENETFKPIGKLALSAALSELTVPEYEAMTETQVESARERVKTGKATVQDFRDLEGENPERRVMRFIPVKGEKIREDFSQTKKRKLDFNSADNTLVFDKSMQGNTSYIPLVEEHIVPAEYIESGLLPDVVVDSKRMLGDMKAQDVANFQAATGFIIQLMNGGYDKVDLDKLVGKTLEFANIDSDDIIKTEESGQIQQVKDLVDQMRQSLDPTQQPNDVSTISGTTDLGALDALGGEEKQPQGALERIASSTI